MACDYDPCLLLNFVWRRFWFAKSLQALLGLKILTFILVLNKSTEKLASAGHETGHEKLGMKSWAWKRSLSRSTLPSPQSTVSGTQRS